MEVAQGVLNRIEGVEHPWQLLFLPIKSFTFLLQRLCQKLPFTGLAREVPYLKNEFVQGHLRR